MEKINKRYLATAGAALLLGGVALVSTSASASNGSTIPSPMVAPSVSGPMVVSGSTDSPEVGDSADSSAVTSSSDAPEVGDSADSTDVTSSTDTQEADDSVDSADVATATDTSQTEDAVDSGN